MYTLYKNVSVSIETHIPGSRTEKEPDEDPMDPEITTRD